MKKKSQRKTDWREVHIAAEISYLAVAKKLLAGEPKLDVFLKCHREQVARWFLEPAKETAKRKHGGVAAVSLIVAVIEPLAAYQIGELEQLRSLG